MASVPTLKAGANQPFPNGLRLGASNHYVFSAAFDPNTASPTVYPTLVVAALGSICLRADTGDVMRKTGNATPQAPTGTWTAM